MKKRITAIILTAAFSAAALAACGDRSAQEANNPPVDTESERTEAQNPNQPKEPANKGDESGTQAGADEAALSELTGILEEIASTVEIGTAGSSLKAVPVTIKLMDWAANYELSDEAVSAAILQYAAGLDEAAGAEFKDQYDLVYGDSKELSGDQGQMLLDDAGVEAPNYPYDTAKQTEIEAMARALQ